MEAILSAIMLASFLGVVQFFSENIISVCGRYYTHVISFSAGVSTTYIFIDLIPHFSEQAVHINRFMFLSFLAGFVVIHLIEKYIYQHSPHQRLEKRLGFENQAASFAYHFILGIIILEFAGRSFGEALLLFIPVMIFTAVNTLPVHKHPSPGINILVSSSTLLGVLFAGFIYTSISPAVQTSLLGFIIGGILFSVIRHSLPGGTEGKPLYFFLGVAVYSPLIIANWIM